MPPVIPQDQPCCSYSNVPSGTPTARGGQQRQRGWRRPQPCVATYKRERQSPLIRRGAERSLFDAGFEVPGAAATAAGLIASSRAGPGLQQPRPPAGAPPKLRVAVDVDEVLGRFLHSLNQYVLEAHGESYAIADYHVYNFAQVWRCSQDESNRRVHAFFASRHFAAGIEPIPGAAAALGRLRAESVCDLMVVTSRQHVIQQPTLEWLARHFPGAFSSVNFGNHWALEGPSRSKSEICASLGAQVLIDDNPGYALECAAAGIHVLLYDWEHGYPWARTPEGPAHDLITRVRDWGEVEVVLGVLAARQEGR